MITVDQVIQNILNDISLSTSYLKEYPLPEPYCPVETKKIKAFVLGTDPSNFSDNHKPRKISFVFDIGSDKRYFSSINQNLEVIGLSLENVFVENMVRNYMDQETASNTKWDLFAEKWLPYIKQEFDSIDPAKKIPVLITAQVILKFLSLTPLEIGKPGDYYKGIRKIPIPSLENKLGRNLIPFYRHLEYSLKKQDNYREKVNKIITE